MPNKYINASDRDLLGKLVDMSKYDRRAAFVLAQITDDDLYDVVSELRRRCARHEAQAVLANESGLGRNGRMKSATTVEIDSARWKAYFANRRIRLLEVGPLVGLSEGWASVVGCKKRASVLTLDKVAVELGVDLDSFLFAVGSDRERKRVGLLR